MLSENLPFARFIEAEPNVLEIFINDGVKLDQSKTALIVEELNKRYNHPYAIISNKWNSYSHTNDYVAVITKLRNLVGLVILIHGSGLNGAVEEHALIQENAMTFYRRPEAISWLKQKLEDAYNSRVKR